MEGRSKPKKCESFRNSRNVPWKSCSGTTKKGNYKKPMMSESSAERKDTLIGEVSERYIVMSSTNPMPITLERILSTKNIILGSEKIFPLKWVSEGFLLRNVIQKVLSHSKERCFVISSFDFYPFCQILGATRDGAVFLFLKMRKTRYHRQKVSSTAV